MSFETGYEIEQRARADSQRRLAVSKQLPALPAPSRASVPHPPTNPPHLSADHFPRSSPHVASLPTPTRQPTTSVDTPVRASSSRPSVSATPLRVPDFGPAQPAEPPRMQDIPEEERPDLPAARLRRNRPHVNYAAKVARDVRFEDDDGHVLLISGDKSPLHAPAADPKNRKEAMADDPTGWAAAEAKELENHKNNHSFELIDKEEFEREAPGRRLVKLVWVYKRKRNGKLKARLCVQGCSQQPGVDYDQTHCATMRGTSLRMLSALASKHELAMRRWDFVSAFLQGDLEKGEVVYIYI